MARREDWTFRRRRRRRGRVLLLTLLLGAAATAAVATAVSETTGGRRRPTLLSTTRPAKPAARRAPAFPARPQFVTVSFDGAGDAGLWRYWRRVGRRVGARFTFFLSGVYLLGEEHRSAYLPPRHVPGRSDIGFMQRIGPTSSRARVRALLGQLALGRREGHEIATHFNGHFCAPYLGNVGEWSAADWRQELSQFDELLTRANALNGIRRPVRLGFGPPDVVGARTPCFEGNLGVLDGVLRERGFRYDSSGSVRLGTWPERSRGIWRLPLPEIRLVGSDLRVIAMDYNLLRNQDPAGAEERAYRSFLHAFVQVYNGARAPFAIGLHFARWNGGAYVRATTRFLERVCRLRAVRCVPYADVVDWLEARGQAQGVPRQ